MAEFVTVADLQHVGFTDAAVIPIASRIYKGLETAPCYGLRHSDKGAVSLPLWYLVPHHVRPLRREDGEDDEATGVPRLGIVTDQCRDGRRLRRRQPGRRLGREDRLQVLVRSPDFRSGR